MPARLIGLALSKSPYFERVLRHAQRDLVLVPESIGLDNVHVFDLVGKLLLKRDPCDSLSAFRPLTCKTLKICLQFSHRRCRMSTMKLNLGSPFDELRTKAGMRGDRARARRHSLDRG